MRKAGQEPFVSHVLATYPDMDMRSMRDLQRSYANAFKHMNNPNGQERDDAVLLLKFSDRQNDATLFVGWYDYAAACRAEPLEAQVFQAWYFALQPEALAPDVDHSRYSKIFPGIGQGRGLNKNKCCGRLLSVTEERQR